MGIHLVIISYNKKRNMRILTSNKTQFSLLKRKVIQDENVYKLRLRSLLWLEANLINFISICYVICLRCKANRRRSLTARKNVGILGYVKNIWQSNFKCWDNFSLLYIGRWKSISSENWHTFLQSRRKTNIEWDKIFDNDQDFLYDF